MKEEALSPSYVPISRIVVSKDEAQSCTVGDTAEFRVSGKITDIHECEDESSKYYEITLEQSNSSKEEKNLESMSPEEMRKKLPVAER
jgi:hypothetical protein